MSCVQWPIRPCPRHMSILADISTNHWLSIVMVPKIPSQTKGRMQIPGFFGGAEGTIQFNLVPIPIVYRPPNP